MDVQLVKQKNLLCEAERICTEKGLSLTDVRKRVLELLLVADGPVKAYDLLLKLKPGKIAQPPTIYRALDFLVQAGFVHKIEALSAFTPCLHMRADGNVEFFICEVCGSVDERHLKTKRNNWPGGFLASRSVVEHYGRCKQCVQA